MSFDGYEDFMSCLYEKSKGNESDNNKLRKLVKNVVYEVIAERLTDKQREYILLYYFGHKTMTQIASEQGLNKGTVSRTIKRGLDKIKNTIKYYPLR